MADLFVDVDTAIVVPMNDMPLVDDTDFKTLETALVYNSAGIKVYWHFLTTAGAYTIVEIHPTTAGVHDISEPIADIGHYGIEIPASGGDHANNDTEGVGWITGLATGIYHFKGPKILCRAAALNNRDVDNTTDAIGAMLTDIHDTDLPAVATAVGDVHATDLPAIASMLTDIHGTDLPAVATAVGDMHATDLPAVASMLTDIHVTDLPAVKAETAAIVVDLADLHTDVGTASTHAAAAHVAIDDATNGLAAIKTMLNDVHGTDLPAVANSIADIHNTDLPAIKGETATILVDTAALDAAWANGGRLDLILDSISPAATAGAVRTELTTELAAIVDIHNTDLPAAKAVLDNIHGTDLPAVASALADIHDTDLPALVNKVDDIHGTDLPAVKNAIDGVGVDAASVHTKIDALHDFDPAADTVAHVTLVDTTTTNTDALQWLYEPPA